MVVLCYSGSDLVSGRCCPGSWKSGFPTDPTHSQVVAEYLNIRSQDELLPLSQEFWFFILFLSLSRLSCTLQMDGFAVLFKDVKGFFS